MIWLPRHVGILNSYGERGRIVLLLGLAGWTLDVYVWPTRRRALWRMPEFGVLLDVRLGRLEVQVRRVLPRAR